MAHTKWWQVLELSVVLALLLVSHIYAQERVQSDGFITYRLAADDHLYRLAARNGAEPEDLTQQLDALGTSGADEWVNMSPDGAWLLFSTERFGADCVGWPCLAWGPADLSRMQTLYYREGDRLLPTRGEFGAISSDGLTVIFPAGDGPHAVDLWITHRDGELWTAPTVLTAASPYPYHLYPALSADGRRVVFDCSAVPYSQETTAICMIDADGTNFRVVITPDDLPPGAEPGSTLHHPDFMPDDEGIVFEADWGGERIWYLAPDAEVPVLLMADYGNDNSPCVLPDGRIVSLWLNRPGSVGTHEIKVMDAVQPADYYMALVDGDVLDIGIGCGGSSPK